jgi:hypothetical protein
MGAFMSFLECKQSNVAEQSTTAKQAEQSTTVGQAEQSTTVGQVNTGEAIQPQQAMKGDETEDEEPLDLNEIAGQEQQQQEIPSDDDFNGIIAGIKTPDDVTQIKNMYKLTDQQLQQLDAMSAQLSSMQGGRRYQRRRNSKKRAKSSHIKKSNRRRKY